MSVEGPSHIKKCKIQIKIDIQIIKTLVAWTRYYCNSNIDIHEILGAIICTMKILFISQGRIVEY